MSVTSSDLFLTADEIGAPPAWLKLTTITPREFRAERDGRPLRYALDRSEHGTVAFAATETHLCGLLFHDGTEADAVSELATRFPKVSLAEDDSVADTYRPLVSELLSGKRPKSVKVLLVGTEFRTRVWSALAGIPHGRLSTYGRLATAIGQSNASRAVGQALGANNLGLLIPCHRVLDGCGRLGGFRWGPERKRALLARELGPDAADALFGTAVSTS